MESLEGLRFTRIVLIGNVTNVIRIQRKFPDFQWVSPIGVRVANCKLSIGSTPGLIIRFVLISSETINN